MEQVSEVGRPRAEDRGQGTAVNGQGPGIRKQKRAVGGPIAEV